ncbi:MAG: hypothetical protein WBD51_18395, partial [Burkholderiaceae bacterium]
ALASVFYDALPAEIDQIERINAALALLRSQVPDEFPFKPIQIVAITPSEPIEEIALRHVKSMPPRVRSFLKTFGATESNGIALASYLLFEPEFTAELIELGKRDAYAKATELKELFSADETGTDAGTVTALKGSLQEFFRRFTR